MEFDIDICSLSKNFYDDYPIKKYPEIMCKENRPYTCLLIDFHNKYLICIPFRSNVKHSESFTFSNTKRSKKSKSGLDYKKAILIENKRYIDNNNVVVDSDEYREMIKNKNKIANDINNYINEYISFANGEKSAKCKEYDRKYKYSTLPYFNDILGIK